MFYQIVKHTKRVFYRVSPHILQSTFLLEMAKTFSLKKFVMEFSAKQQKVLEMWHRRVMHGSGLFVCKYPNFADVFQRGRLVTKLKHRSDAPGNTTRIMKTNPVKKAMCV